MHRLCVFTASNDPQGNAIFERLRSWLDRDGQRLNVVLERVNADDPSVRWEAYGIPGQPPSLPVAALIGEMPTTTRRAFVIDHWEPAPSDADLAALLASPVRDAIKATIADVWAVVVYSPAAKAEQSNEAVLNSVSKQWAAEHAPGISIVRLDRTDPRERTLCSFLGLDASAPDWAGVVFGRGKLLAPPLVGDNITENSLNQLLIGLTVPCTCLQQSMNLGLDLPMTWEPELEAKAAAAAQSVGYTETVVSLAAPEEPLAALVKEIPQEDRDVFAGALLPLGCAAGIAALAVAAIVLRARRRRAMPLEE